MSFAPYNPGTLNRIRKGSCARDLGWDDEFYRSVCRKHGIEPVTVMLSTVVAPPRTPLSCSSAGVPKPAPTSVKSPTGPVTYDIINREVRRGAVIVNLSGTAQAIFEYLRDVPDGHLAGGPAIAGSAGIGTSSVATMVRALAKKLRPLGIGVEGVVASRRGGYYLIDLNRARRIKVETP